MDNYLTNHPYRSLTPGIIILLVVFGFLAVWRYSKMPRQKQQKVRVDQSLERIASNFIAKQRSLLHQSQDLADQLKRELAQNYSPKQLYNGLENYPQFWGIVLYQAKKPVVWNGFSLTAPGLLDKIKKKAPKVRVIQDNNVTYWLIQVDFKVESKKNTVEYHLFTAKRIRQHNALSIGSSKNFSILNGSASDDLYNKKINIGKPLPDQYSGYRVLKTFSGDSVGAVVATAKNFRNVKIHWMQKNHLWRSIFGVFCLLLFAVYLFIWVDTKEAWQALLFQIIILGIVWFVLNQVDIAQNWLPVFLKGMQDTLLNSYQNLCEFFIDAFLFLCFVYTLKKKLKYFHFKYDDNSFIGVIVTAFCAGFINAIVVALTFKECYKLVYHSQIPLLTLHIFPPAGTLLFYICIGILFLALANIIMDFNRFLMTVCRGFFNLVPILCCSGFIIGMFVLSIYGLGRPYSSWVFVISLIYFGIIFSLSTVSFRRLFSPLRTTAIYSFIIAMAGSAVIYQANIHQLDGDLRNVIQEYTTNTDRHAEELTHTLLHELYFYYQSNQDSTVADRLSYLQAQIPTIIRTEVAQNNNFYFYDVQLRNDQDSVLLNFSNNLNTPQWMQEYTIDQLQIVTSIQNITAIGNRPIVQHPILEDANKYQSFYRGWIALYSPNKIEPVGWILCSIYRNYPNFSKPLRSVINQQYYQYQQHSYLIATYKNGRLKQKKYLGFPGRYPVYTVLKAKGKQAVDSTHPDYYTSYHDHDSYRNLLIKLSNDHIIKVSTLIPGYQNILFLYFQLSLILFVVGFILTVLVRWFESGRFSLFGTDNRFQYRILDSFLLATIVFLILLVCITWVGTSHQNEELVKQQLFKKLTSLTTVVEKSSFIGKNSQINDSGLFDMLATKLNVDALLYRKRILVESTTPQIYRQNLLPKVMPFPVYQDLYLQRARESYSVVQLNDQKMILGYRSVQPASGKPVATVAIPTFIKSPLYNRQILRMTSYLIILYIIIFGIFIIGTVLITRRLTKPLDHLQRGLREISRGELETRIPVTSRDEIGNLAKVYNEMVERLRELRKELAETERESAWQEMAQQVAHEIKNPLTPMKLNIQYLERQLANGDYSVQELTQRITEVTQNLTVQINSLSGIASDFSKFSQPLKQEDFEEVDVNTLIQSVTDLYKHDSHINIKLEDNALDSIVLGIEDELHRVFVNLVKNAQEAIKNDGVVKFKTYNGDGSIFMEVDDNGQGIAEEDKARIFVPNFSTKSSGTGLGLAICRKVIEAHKGSISFASIEGEGTTFVIKLPLKSQL